MGYAHLGVKYLTPSSLRDSGTSCRHWGSVYLRGTSLKDRGTSNLPFLSLAPSSFILGWGLHDMSEELTDLALLEALNNEGCGLTTLSLRRGTGGGHRSSLLGMIGGHSSALPGMMGGFTLLGKGGGSPFCPRAVWAA